ncbi:MAG: PAS domain-containing protein [Planctomycetaceae bacterium]|nr:PAS domain-containing protein [Planctomycetaceae bacterium]MCB9952327.1 PAS domain-containing protein [Planctomycetaceae bacterium]
MKWTTTDWLIILGCLLPTAMTALIGAAVHLPGSVILWQSWMGGITGLAFLFAVRWSISGTRKRHVEATQELNAAVRKEFVKVPVSDPTQDHWAAAWNDTTAFVCTTINELRGDQRTLQENRALLETVLGTMSEGVLVLDEKLTILFANASSRRILDVPQSNPVGRPVWEVTRSQPLLEFLQRPELRENEVQQSVELTRQNIVLEVNTSPLPLATSAGVVAVMHNVTELRKLENARRDFFNSVSHELKTPLTSIQCFAETLLDGGLEDEQNNRHMVGQIERQAEKLHVLIQDILKLARIESRFEKFELVPINVSKVIGECISDRTPIATAREITFDLEEGDKSALVLGDETGFRSIIDNLLNNAINYNHAGGKVTVRWRREGDQVHIDVIDTGIGISREDQERVFERFYRVDKARSATSGGTGLGLAIVKHLVTVFHGSISVSSEVGKGSTFTLSLPLLNVATS